MGKRKIHLLIYLSLFFIGLEGIFRVFLPQASVFYFKYDLKSHSRIPKVVEYNENFNGREFQSFLPIYLFTNKRGELFQKKVYSYQEKNKDLRIMLLGSSNMFQFPEEKYEKALGKSIELINCSIIGSNFLTYLKNIQSFCHGYESIDIVIVQLSLYPEEILVKQANGLFVGEYLTDDPEYFIWKQGQGVLKPYGEELWYQDKLDFPISNKKDLNEYLGMLSRGENVFYQNVHLFRFFYNLNYILTAQRERKKLDKIKLPVKPHMDKTLKIYKKFKEALPNTKFVFLAQSDRGYQEFMKYPEYIKIYEEFKKKISSEDTIFLDTYKSVRSSDIIDDRHYYPHFQEKHFQKLIEIIKRIKFRE